MSVTSHVREGRLLGMVWRGWPHASRSPARGPDGSWVLWRTDLRPDARSGPVGWRRADGDAPWSEWEAPASFAAALALALGRLPQDGGILILWDSASPSRGALTVRTAVLLLTGSSFQAPPWNAPPDWMPAGVLPEIDVAGVMSS